MPTYYDLDLTAANVNAALNEADAIKTARTSASAGQVLTKTSTGYSFLTPVGNVSSVNGMTGAVVIEPEVYNPVYGTTTSADIYQAWQDGKIVYFDAKVAGVSNFNQTWYLSSASSTVAYFFSPASNNTAKNYILSVTGSTWASSAIECQSVANRISTWNTTLLAYKYPTAKLVKDSLDAKADAVTIKTTMDNTATANTLYLLGEQAAVTVTLPASPAAGDEIGVIFYSGATAATLSVVGTTIGTVPTPVANQRVELRIMYDGTNWAVKSETIGV